MASPSPAAPGESSLEPERWGIVGGGILGMTLAHRLSQRGRRVTLIEAADHLGGLASAWRLGDVLWDRHYHVTLRSDTHLIAILAELGLEREMRWEATRTGFYTGGRLVPMSNALEFLRFPSLDLWDKARLAATILYASRIRNWKKLERVSAADWLRRFSGRRTYERIWLPLLRAKLGESYGKASAAFIWAIIARLYAARRAGLGRDVFGYVPGGYARVLERFAELLAAEDVTIKLKRRAVRVEAAGGPQAGGDAGGHGGRGWGGWGGWGGTEGPGHGGTGGAVAVAFEDGERETFDRVVVTLPAPLAARLCPGLSDEERSRLHGIHYQGIVCASLLLKRPLADFYVTNLTDAGIPFTAVIEMSALVDREHFGGNALVYLPKYVGSDDPGFETPDHEVEESFLTALARMYPRFRRDDVLCFRISRVRHVLALSTLNYSERLPPMTTSLAGVYIVNSAHIVNGTLNVNETVQLAERAARWLLA